MRLNFRQTDMAVRAGKMLAECQYLFRTHLKNMNNAVCQLGRCFQRVCQTRQNAFFNDQPVDNHINRMLFIFIQGNVV